MPDVIEVKEYESPNEQYGLRIEYVLDEAPDLSFLGEYSNTWEEGAIDRQETGDWSRHELRYFIPGQHVPHDPKNWAHVSKKDKAEVIRKYGSLRKADEAYAMEDYERMEAYNRGDWHMMGIVATIFKGPFKEVGSDSLWGIESDSDESYIEETEDAMIRGAEHAAGLPEIEWEEL